MGNDKTFLKVSMRLVRELGSDEAILYAFLQNCSKVWKKDADGYFTVFSSYIMKETGLGHTKFYKTRDRIIEVGLLRFKQGVNQNIKNKYKLV